MSVRGVRRTRCSGTKRYMCTNISMKLIMTRGWSPLRIIENESILAHVGGALRWPLKVRLIETNWVLFSLCRTESLRMRPFSPFETHRDQMTPQVAHWVHFRFHSDCQSLPESMLTQFYVATRPQRVKSESKLKKPRRLNTFDWSSSFSKHKW